MAETIQNAQRIIRRRELEVKIGLGRSAIYERTNPKSPYYDPTFPKPIKLGGGKNPPIGFLEAEADSWLSAQIKKSRPAD